MAFATSQGVRLYWRLDGRPDKPALLLLNSIGTDMGLWDPVVQFVLPQFRVLRMDTRGHGASDAPSGDYSLEILAEDALAVMDAAGLENAAVCGLSLGGMIAMTLALRAPDRVTALICACTSPQMDAAIWRTRVETVRAHGTAGIADMAMQRFFAEDFARTHPEVVATTRTALLAMSADGYAGCSAAIRDMRLIDRLAGITTPTLVISGAKDVSTPAEGHGERIAAAIPGARARSLDAAHLACLESPAAFAGLVRDFLTEGRRGAGVRDAAEALFEAGLKVRRQVLGD